MASRARGGRGRRGGGDGAATILVRRIEESPHARTTHHGGAWKVAYADFVTAMMAFFLLMWLLNSTTEEQRRAIAEFFAPPHPLGRAATGSGRPFGGLTPNDDGMLTITAGTVVVEPGPQPIAEPAEEDESETPARPAPPHDGPPEAGDEVGSRGGREGAAAWPRGQPGEASPPVTPREAQATAAAAPLAAPAPPRPEERPAPADPDALLRAQSEAALRAELARRETMELERAAERIRSAVRDDPALADLARQLLVEQTPQGLRIQLLDAERQPMFALGDSMPNERARALLARIVPVIAALPNAISIAGHTDATPFRGTGPLARSNWDLSAERANATRRVLLEAGIAGTRIHSVAGHAEREPLLPEQPTAAANRRVAVTLLRMVPPDAAPSARPETEPRTGTAR
jgi:chemotaxis protein MotB